MSRCRFVQPEVVRVPLSDGEYFIDIKRELNTGERRRVFSHMVRNGVVAGEKTVLDPEQVGLTKVVEYLVGWSLVDAAGKPVPVSEAALKNLDVETFVEIREAIDAHEEAQDTRREDERKNQAGSTGLNPISTSVEP